MKNKFGILKLFVAVCLFAATLLLDASAIFNNGINLTVSSAKASLSSECGWTNYPEVGPSPFKFCDFEGSESCTCGDLE